MNKRDELIRINNVARLIEPSHRHKNALKYNPEGESLDHIDQKYAVWKHLMNLAQTTYCEAVFMDGLGRADLIWANRGLIIEIVNSEKEESKVRKQNRYPLPIVFIKASEPFEPRMIE